MKRPIFLISTHGKSKEQMIKDAREAFKKFLRTEEESGKEISDKKLK